MYIISKFHDYYDVGMKLGIDKAVIYERDTTTIKKIFPLRPTTESGWAEAVVAFCGKFYPFIYHQIEGIVDRIIWDVELAVVALPTSRRTYIWNNDIGSEKGIREFFARQYPQLETLFHEHKTPIFAFNPSRIRANFWLNDGPYRSLVINPCLKDWEFYKVKDPITAFQEVHMFVSGVIGAPARPTVKISDKDMAASKGHDGKYSFRKPPGKRGKNKWR